MAESMHDRPSDCPCLPQTCVPHPRFPRGSAATPKRAARKGKAYADESVEWRRAAKQVFREQQQAIKAQASAGDLLKELQAYREAFEKLQAVLK